MRQDHAAVTPIEVRQFRRDAALDGRRTLAGNCRSNARDIVIDKLQLLLIGRLFVSLVELRRQLAAANNQECALRHRSHDRSSKKTAIEERYRDEQNKTDQKDAAARFHIALVRRRRVNQQRTNYGRCCDRKNMLGSISQTARFCVSIVTPNNVKRLYDHDQRDAIDQNKFERADKKCVTPHVTHKTVDQHPANDVTKRTEQPDCPIVVASTGNYPLRFHALTGGLIATLPRCRLTRILYKNIRLRRFA